MSLWFGTRRWWVAGIGLLVFFLGAVLAGERQAVVPAFTPIGSATVKLMLFLPVPVCLSVLYCLENALVAAELTAIRRTAAYDRAALVTAGVLAQVAAALCGLLVQTPTAQAAGRNVLFLVGLMLATRAVLGPLAAGAVCVGWLVLVTLVGYGGDLRPHAWTVVLRDSHDVLSGLVSCALFAVGVGLVGKGRRPSPVA
ncbi:hypothetical protein VM636_21880 [Streptomyces sp. SCSIO 75703]|uniref:hypothetical protein n=1 Tax=unclassified Streptomyces TaxID=2593676 RepID=UPI0006B68930|nr:hypothetical protein [Streptomyces sp. TP-A0875]